MVGKSERFFQFALLGLIASGFIAIAGSESVSPWLSATAGLGLLWRAAIVWGVRRAAVSNRWATIATAAYIVFVPFDLFFLSRSWIGTSIHVVFFVAIVKTLTASSGRDYLFVSAIAFLELLAAALLSANTTFFIWLACYLLCSVAAVAAYQVWRVERSSVLARAPRERLSARLLAATAVFASAILLLSAALFFLLPRTTNAAMRLLGSSRYHLSGFSSEVALGEVGGMKTDLRPVLHVLAYYNALPLNLKWRGLALERFDGQRWSTEFSLFHPLPRERGIAVTADDWQRRRKGERTLYKVELQNVDADALFVAGIPEFLNVTGAGVLRAPNGALRFGYVGGENIQYEVSSFLRPDAGVSPEPHTFRLTSAERAKNLALPAIDARIRDLAVRLTRDAPGDARKAHQLEDRLRADYGYTLDLPQQESRDPLATFLFDRRKGHCEYFASAMTVMLRSLNIPARLVNGFQSGTLNPYTGMLVIRASDAHTWVEAFLPGAGWTAFDPTPPGAPIAQDAWGTRWNLYVDAANTFWQDWVLSYGLGQQQNLASRLGTGVRHASTWQWPSWNRSWILPASAWGRPALASCGMIAIFYLSKRWRSLSPLRKVKSGHSEPADATLLYQRMLNSLGKKGIRKADWVTPQEFAKNGTGEISTDVTTFTTAYNALRFGGDGAHSLDLTAALERIERS